MKPDAAKAGVKLRWRRKLRHRLRALAARDNGYPELRAMGTISEQAARVGAHE